MIIGLLTSNAKFSKSHVSPATTHIFTIESFPRDKPTKKGTLSVANI